MWGAIAQAIDHAAGRVNEGMGAGIKVASSQTPSQAATMDEPVYTFTSPSEGDTTEISSAINKKIESAKKAAKAKTNEAPKTVSSPVTDNSPPAAEPEAPKASSPSNKIKEDIGLPFKLADSIMSNGEMSKRLENKEENTSKPESESHIDILEENIKNSIKNGEDLYNDGINTRDSSEVLNKVKDVTKNAIKEATKNARKHAAEAIKSDAKKAAEKGAKKTMERWNLKPKEKTTESVTDEKPASAEPEKTNEEDYKPAKMMADRIRDVTGNTIKDIINLRTKDAEDDSLSDKNAKSAKLLSKDNCLAKKAAENTVKNWHKLNFKSNTKEGK